MGSPVPARALDARGVQTYTRNILKVYRSADPDHYVTGAAWYDRAHDIAADLAHGDLTTRHVAGVIAALSPQNGWEKNVKGARTAVRNGTAKGLHTGCQTRKADAILLGADPLDVLGGQKERAFFGNIADPRDLAPVTIDRHAHDIAIGRKFRDDEDRGLSSVGRYANLSLAYRRAAAIVGELPSTVQAVTWQAWTGRTTLEPIVLSDDAWLAGYATA